MPSQLCSYQTPAMKPSRCGWGTPGVVAAGCGKLVWVVAPLSLSGAARFRIFLLPLKFSFVLFSILNCPKFSGGLTVGRCLITIAASVDLCVGLPVPILSLLHELCHLMVKFCFPGPHCVTTTAVNHRALWGSRCSRGIMAVPPNSAGISSARTNLFPRPSSSPGRCFTGIWH